MQLVDEVAGRVVMVTGAGRGIGREVAAQLAAAGATVALVARSVGELNDTARAIEDAGGRAKAFPADLQNTAAIPALVESIVAELGPVEVLINNAGVGWPFGDSTKVDIVDWTAALAINLTAPAALSFAVLPGMFERGRGRILNVSSIAVYWPTAMVGTNAYVTSKSALEAHTVNLAAEVKDRGVQVNAFRPGTVDTDMHTTIRTLPPGTVEETLQARFVRAHDEGTLISPTESARSLLAHLLLPETGQVWDVSDGL